MPTRYRNGDRYTVGMARRADHLRSPIVDVVDDGLTEAEIAARVEEWLDELLASEPVDLGVSAADELAEARRLGEV
jgi:hypothetical protein